MIAYIHFLSTRKYLLNFIENQSHVMLDFITKVTFSRHFEHNYQ
jgi:hypothetical protein